MSIETKTYCLYSRYSYINNIHDSHDSHEILILVRHAVYSSFTRRVVVDIICVCDVDYSAIKAP